MGTLHLPHQALIAACTVVTVGWPNGAAAAPVGDLWSQSRATATNNGIVHITLSQTVRLEPWQFDGSGRVWGYRPGMTVWSSPAVGRVADRAVVAVGSYDHKLYVLDAITGKRLYTVTTGGGVYATPTLHAGDDDDVWLLVTSSDRLVYALDAATGRQRWVHGVIDYRPTLGDGRLSSAVVADTAQGATVFVGHWLWDRTLARNQQDGAITALALATGQPRWTRRLGDNRITDPVVADVGEVPQGAPRLFVGSANGNTYGLDAETGDVRWSRTELDAVLGAPAFLSTPAGPRVVTASKTGEVRCLDAVTGSEHWSYRTGDWITSSPVIAELHARTVVLVGSYDRSVYALDLLSGELAWRYHADGGIHSPVTAVSAGGRSHVLASAWDHHLHAINARDGRELWRQFTGRPLWDTVGLEHETWSAPTAARINGQWMAYVGSYDGTLYAWPIAQLMISAGVGSRSNLAFWISFPLVLAAIGVLAWALTRRHRRRGAAASVADAEPTRGG